MLTVLDLTGTIAALYIKNGLERKYKRSKPFLSAYGHGTNEKP
jgi:hypothetical protein